MLDRLAFRAHPLDGAMLYFQPETGTHIRVESEATRASRRRAPRVVMFGITNHCNLRCAFCSRDATRESLWTVESAYEVLAGLAAAGTLEVAFGGGEPFLFRGFTELLRRLRDTTPLALHVTTNGTRLDALDGDHLAGALGIVRLSIYDELDWRAAGAHLSFVGQRWGANVLVEEATLAGLPSTLEALARLGARDVSLLSYVGPERSRHLSAEGEARLARIVRASPLPARLSVCLGDRVEAPRLFDGADDGGDCGAGRDFVSITPDRRVQSCSFQDASFPIETAADVLSVWNGQREALAHGASREGCARSGGVRAARSRRSASLRVWQSFSGNNSGECVMVARFATVEDAESFLAELVPGFVAGEPYSAPWRALFAEERVKTPALDHALSPEELLSAGRAVFARTSSAADDDFPELRALAWKRGGEVLAGGIHEHDTPRMLFVVRTDDAEGTLASARARDPDALAVRHGDLVLGALPVRGALAGTVSLLHEIARGLPIAQEIFFGPLDLTKLTDEAKRLSTSVAETRRMACWFWGPTPEKRADRAADFERALGDVDTARLASSVVTEGVHRNKRLAVLGHRAGAHVVPLLASEVHVHVQLWREAPPRTRGKRAPAPPALDVAAVRAAVTPRLRALLGPRPFELSCEAGPSWRQGVALRVSTDAPRLVLQAIGEAVAAEIPDVSVAASVTDTSVLAFALRRLVAEVRSRSG